MGKVPASSGFVSSLYAAARPPEEPAELGCSLRLLFQLSLAHFWDSYDHLCAKRVASTGYTHFMCFSEKDFSGPFIQSEHNLNSFPKYTSR